MIMKKSDKATRPLIRLTVIIIPTVIIVAATLLILNYNGFFLSVPEKAAGEWTRTRQGSYSKQDHVEVYSFQEDGSGTKTFTSPDGYTATKEFTWYVTPTNMLVIDNYVKYEWNPNHREYYNESAKTTKKYWFVTKNNLYIGQNTSMKSEVYNRK